MPIEYVPVLDEDGNDVGGYTESVPEMPVKEEPDCYACNDNGCPGCDASIPDPLAPWPDTEPAGGYSDEPPY